MRFSINELYHFLSELKQGKKIEDVLMAMIQLAIDQENFKRMNRGLEPL